MRKDNIRMALTCLRLCLDAFTGFIALQGQTEEKHVTTQPQTSFSHKKMKENWDQASPYYYHLKAIWETHSVWFFCGGKKEATLEGMIMFHFYTSCDGHRRFRPRGHSPSLSNHRCDFHILLNAISILLFGVINPLPLLQFNHPNKEMQTTVRYFYWKQNESATKQLLHGGVCGSGWATLLLRVWRGALLGSSMLCSMCPHLQTAVVVKKGLSCC